MKRFNINLPEDLYDHYSDISKRMGVPMSALMILDMQHYIEQSKAMTAVTNPEFVKMINAAIALEGKKVK